MDSQHHNPELGYWEAPGSAEVSGPSSLDYEDEFAGPITGALTTAESAPHFDAAAWAWLTTPLAMEGSQHDV